jgi:hypothetical protein
MVKSISAIFRCFHALSLDVTGGALAVGLFAIRFLHVQANPWWWPVLALSVWVVYTADHLIDSYSQKQTVVIFRHRLHHRYRRFFVAAVGLAALTDVTVVWFFMNRQILLFGLLLALGALAYLLVVLAVQKSGFYFHKEFFVAFFYVAAIWLAPVIWYAKPLQWWHLFTMMVFGLLAWVEGLMMTVFERDADREEQTHSFSTYYGVHITRIFVLSLLGIAFLLSVYLLISFPGLYFEFGLLILMSLLLTLLLFFEHWFEKHGRYRLFGEFVFWLPFLLILR